MEKIKVGIVGYGNLGKGVEKALVYNPDFELVAIFTRREPDASKPLHVSFQDIEKYKGKIDIMILCGGSATDLPNQGPVVASMFHTVDSFDTHAKIPEYFAKIDSAAKEAGTLSLISTGWDPGIFSLNRLLGECILPQGNTYTFWGKGVSQGHSDAIRRIAGVKNGIQYTVPIEKAIERVRTGENPILATREKHTRVCYVVAEDGADQESIANQIKSMPNYFADYETIVHFISEEEMKRGHSTMPHGGFVIRTGETGIPEATVKQRMEFQIVLGDNPDFTSSVIVAFTRAIYRMAKEGQTGARSVFDIPFGSLSPKSREELLREFL